MSVDASVKRLIENYDPSKLIPTKNVRPVELDEEFVGSIREHGLLQPVIATPYEDGFAIVLGNRRTAGAVQAARTVDVIVRDDLTDDAIRLISQLVENVHRADMRPTEIAAAYAQLALDFGLSEEDIAKKLSKDTKEIRASIALHDMPKAAQEAADRGVLDLDTAAQLDAFETDPKAYKRLLKVIEQNGNLSYALREEERRQERAEQKAVLLTELTKSGVRVIPRPKDFGWKSQAVRLTRLSDVDGNELTPENHATCPGHAAFVETYSQPFATYVCQDPRAYGHQTPASYDYRSPEELAAEEAAAEERKRQQAERREGLSIAAEVRAEFVAGLCRAKKPPKGLMRFCLETVFAHGLSSDDESQETVLRHLGVSDPGEAPQGIFERRLSRFAEARQPLVLLVHVAVRAEELVRDLEIPWRRHESVFVISWLEFLAKQGHQLSGPETELVNELKAREAECIGEEAAGSKDLDPGDIVDLDVDVNWSDQTVDTTQGAGPETSHDATPPEGDTPDQTGDEDPEPPEATNAGRGTEEDAARDGLYAELGEAVAA